MSGNSGPKRYEAAIAAAKASAAASSMSRATADRPLPIVRMPTINPTTYKPPTMNAIVAIPLSHPGNGPANRSSTRTSTSARA